MNDSERLRDINHGTRSVINDGTPLPSASSFAPSVKNTSPQPLSGGEGQSSVGKSGESEGMESPQLTGERLSVIQSVKKAYEAIRAGKKSSTSRQGQFSLSELVRSTGYCVCCHRLQRIAPNGECDHCIGFLLRLVQWDRGLITGNELRLLNLHPEERTPEDQRRIDSILTSIAEAEGY